MILRNRGGSSFSLSFLPLFPHSQDGKETAKISPLTAEKADSKNAQKQRTQRGFLQINTARMYKKRQEIVQNMKKQEV